jgi:hypothetical protein
MSEWKAFRLNPDGGDPIPIPPPTEEQQRSMEEQRQRMFTPDGQFRMVVEIREAFQKGLIKPNTMTENPGGNDRGITP